MRTLPSVIVFSLFTLAGYLLAIQSWGGIVFVYLGEKRAPASVRKLGDYSTVPRSALHRAAHEQLAAPGDVLEQNGSVGIHLGNPLVRNQMGETDFACKVRGREGLFDRVELTFTGTGISEGGENPKMTVESSCEGADPVSDLATIWIPIQDIKRGPAADGNLHFDDLEVRLQSMPGQWPDTWVLSNVRLFRKEEPNRSMTVDTVQMRRSRPALISF